MSTISRKVRVHKYTFWKCDVGAGAVQDVQVRELLGEIPVKKLNDYMMDNKLGGYVVAAHEVVDRKYVMDLDFFVQYAANVGEG